MIQISRRHLLLTSAAGLVLAAGGLPAFAQAKKIKVAAIYTVPVEQQWVSRIHKALNAAVARGDIEYSFSENVSNTDYERVMREYAQKGTDLIVGEAFAVERAARKVANDFPKTAFLIGSSFGPKSQGISEPVARSSPPTYPAVAPPPPPAPSPSPSASASRPSRCAPRASSSASRRPPARARRVG